MARTPAADHRGPIHSLRVTVAASLVAGLLLAAPSVASAADTYVDQDAGDDLNTCLAPGLEACEHIQPAINKAGPGDTTHVADPIAQTTYAETLILVNDKSLIAESPDPAETVISNTGASPAITVQGSGAGTIRGFTIRSQQQPVSLLGDAAIVGNRFDQSLPPSGTFGADLLILGSSSPTVRQNVFADPTASDTQVAVAHASTGVAEISGNSISGFNVGLFVFAAGGATISANNISGTHTLGGGQGFGILVRNATAAISGNSVHDPVAGGLANKAGIGLSELAMGNDTGGTVDHNRVIGLDYGILVDDTQAPVTLDNDIAVKSTLYGLLDVDASGTGGDVSVSSSTFFDSGATDIRTVDTALTLDSVITGSGIDNGGGGGSCSISFSRGPSTGPGCAGFQTTADPAFTNPAANDYGIAAGSPMIDAGNPAAGGSATDLAGNPRVVAGICGGTARRDIGAYEFQPSCPGPQAPAQVMDTSLPQTKIDKGPKKKTSKTTAKFRFESSEPGSSFQCKLDRRPFRRCSSPKTYRHLKPGRHVFKVRAIDAAGNTDATPAKRRFEVLEA